MSYFRNIATAISTLIDGMKVTIGYFVRARDHVTLQYPDEVWPVPSRGIGVGDLDSYNVIRAKLDVNMNDCIGCKQCERACPVNCIHIDTIKADKGEDLGKTSNGTQKRLVVTSFTIDMTECMYCDLCTHPCPEDCIFMTPDYPFNEPSPAAPDVTTTQRWRDRGHLIYQFATVAREEVERRKAAAEASRAVKLATAAKPAGPQKPAEPSQTPPTPPERSNPSLNEIPLKGMPGDPPMAPSKSDTGDENDG